MSVNLAPIFNGAQLFDANGRPLNGGLINTYAAGTTTPLATYTTNIGNVQNANPIVLNSDGRPPNEIWLTAGSSYKFTLTDSLLNLLGTYDNLTGINDISTSTGSLEWTPTGLTPTFISTTSFSLVGNQTANFPPGQRVKTVNTGGTVYSQVTSATFGGANTTVVIANDGTGVLDAGISSVAYSFLQATNPSISPDMVHRQSSALTTTTTIQLYNISGDSAHIAGAGTINSFGTPLFSGQLKVAIFDNTLTISSNPPTLTVPGQQAISTTAGDVALIYADGLTNSRVVSYMKASGGPMVAATQAQQFAGTSNIVTVTPLVQRYHQSALKVVGVCGVAGDLQAGSFNVSSITDTGTGQATVNYTLNFLNNNYTALVNAQNAVSKNFFTYISNSPGAGSCLLNCTNGASAALTDPDTGYHFMMAGQSS